MSDILKPLPCPFCGCADIEMALNTVSDGDVSLFCTQCGARTAPCTYPLPGKPGIIRKWRCHDQEDAITAALHLWNTRRTGGGIANA